MTRHEKSFSSELASEFRKVNQANAEFANLIRELEYPAVRQRIRSPPVPLHLVLLGLLDSFLFVFFRLPLHVLKRFASANFAALLTILLDIRTELRGDFQLLLAALVDTGLYTWHWLGIAGSCLWIELKILGHHALMGALLGVLYVAMVMGFFWLIFFIFGG